MQNHKTEFRKWKTPRRRFRHNEGSCPTYPTIYDEMSFTLIFFFFSFTRPIERCYMVFTDELHDVLFIVEILLRCGVTNSLTLPCYIYVYNWRHFFSTRTLRHGKSFLFSTSCVVVYVVRSRLKLYTPKWSSKTYMNRHHKYTHVLFHLKK